MQLGLAASFGALDASPLRAAEGYSMSGVGGSLHGLDSYQGVVYSPWASLSESGFLVRGWAKTFHFRYQTDLPGDPDVTIDGMGYGAEIDLGWQWTWQAGRIAGFVGPAWRDHLLTPDDPGSSLDRARLGAGLTLDGEWRFAEAYGVMANVRYLTSFDQYWVQARPFLDLGHGWKAGVNLVAYGGPNYGGARLGVFTQGYELRFITWRRVFVGGEISLQADYDGGRLSPYLALHSGFLF